MSYILYYKHNNTLREVKQNDVIRDLYYLKARIPRENDVKTSIKKSSKDVQNFFKSHKFKDAIQIIKDSISKINNVVPLYDEYSKNLYIIARDHVYSRVIYQHYRFPDEAMVNDMKKRRSELEKDVEEIIKTNEKEQNLSDFGKEFKIEYTHKEPSSYFILREYRKLTLMIKFLNSFNLSILKDTYIMVFYYYSNEVGKNITTCKRPSFLPHFGHIKPYYTRSELINLALNLGKIKPSDKYYDIDEITELCDIIKKNDIDKDILLDHQKYIINHNKIGIVQYYSMQGSYFMNQYMRGFTSYQYKNELLEECIKSMWHLINEAPKSFH
jgi:hypothetical protein